MTNKEITAKVQELKELKVLAEELKNQAKQNRDK